MLSSLLWRPCSPPAQGTAATACEEMLGVLYNQSCLARAASEPPRDLHPLYICGEFGVPVQQPAVSRLGVYETPLTAVLTSIHSLASDRALQIHTGCEVMTDWLLRLCAQLELGKAEKFVVWTKIPVTAAPQLAGIDPKMRGNHP